MLTTLPGYGMMSSRNAKNMGKPYNKELFAKCLKDLEALYKNPIPLTKQDIGELKSKWMPKLNDKVDYVLHGRSYNEHCSKGSKESYVTHRNYFVLEDINNNALEQFYHWWRPMMGEDKAKIIFDKVDSVISLVLNLKHVLQRPRAFSTSYWLNDPITTLNTWAGQTPALPSGHALAGFLFGAITFYEHKADGERFNILVRYCRDFGQRRMMGGVHYPSDTLGSKMVYKHVIEHLGLSKDVEPYTNAVLA